MASTETTTQVATSKVPSSNEVEFVKCECCGLSEECTIEYIINVQERFRGRWICGLCAEAVKDEEGRIGNEEAMNQHIGFCKKFMSLRPPPNPTEDLISAMKQLVLRTLDSPRSSPTRCLDSPTSSPTRCLVSPRSSPTRKDAVMVRSRRSFSVLDR